MMEEISMARAQRVTHDMTIRDEAPTVTTGEFDIEVVTARRILRMESNDFLEELKGGDIAKFAVRIGRLAFAAGGVCAQFGLKPGFPEHVVAVAQMMHDAHKEMDRALANHDWTSAGIAVSKMELIWFGTSSSIGIPYYPLLGLLHGSYVKGETPDLRDVAALLRKAGLEVPPLPGEAVNDSAPQAANEP